MFNLHEPIQDYTSYCQIKDIMCYEILQYITDIPLLMQPYSIADFRPIVGAAQLEVQELKSIDGRLCYMPGVWTPSNNIEPWNNTPMPLFNQIFGQPMNYSNTQRRMQTGDVNGVFPIGAHLSPPINSGSNSKILSNANYYKISMPNMGVVPDYIRLIALPRQVAADVAFYEDAGLSFLVN